LLKPQAVGLAAVLKLVPKTGMGHFTDSRAIQPTGSSHRPIELRGRDINFLYLSKALD